MRDSIYAPYISLTVTPSALPSHSTQSHQSIRQEIDISNMPPWEARRFMAPVAPPPEVQSPTELALISMAPPDPPPPPEIKYVHARDDAGDRAIRQLNGIRQARAVRDVRHRIEAHARHRIEIGYCSDHNIHNHGCEWR